MINCEIELDISWTNDCILIEQSNSITDVNSVITSTKLYAPVVTSFRNVNGQFVLSSKNGDNDPMRDSFNKFYMPLIEIKDFKVLIDNKTFFDQPVKTRTRSVRKTY